MTKEEWEARQKHRDELKNTPFPAVAVIEVIKTQTHKIEAPISTLMGGTLEDAFLRPGSIALLQQKAQEYARGLDIRTLRQPNETTVALVLNLDQMTPWEGFHPADLEHEDEPDQHEPEPE